MKKARHLLLRSPLLPGESLPSYLVRLANLNGYHTPNMVAQICQERLSQPDIITRPTRAETYARLAELVKLDDEWLFAASAHTFAITILSASAEPELITLRSGAAVVLLPSAVLRQHMCSETDAQFCPHCLVEASYHRLAWLPQAVSICLAHRSLLIKGCSICGNKLKIADVIEGCCGQCSFDLRTSPTISVAEDYLGLFSQQSIQAWLRISTANRADQAKLSNQPDFILYQIVYGLHRAIRTIQQRWDYLHDPFDVETALSVFPCEKKSELTPFKSYILYATAFKALLRWPHGLFEFLNAFKLRDEAEPTETVVNDLGSIYTSWLMNAWNQPEFSFLQTVFEEYLQTNFAFSMALQQKYRGFTDYSDAIGSDYISYQDAAQRLNTSVVIVERSVKLGLLASYSQSRRPSTSQQFKLVSRDAVSALKRRWRYGIPLYDAARLLGISQEITQGLMETRLIKAVSGPEIDGYKVWKIGSQSLAYFFKRLERGGVRYLYNQPVKMISLARAAEAVAEDGLDTVFLIEQILAGVLRSYWPPGYRNLGQLRVSLEDLEALRQPIGGNGTDSLRLVSEASTGMNSKSPGVRPTASQLARQLGISQDNLRRWIRWGIVMPAPEPEVAESQN